MSSITVKFKDFKKNIHPVSLGADSSVEETKQKLCDTLGNNTTLDQIKLIYSGKVLVNSKSLSTYNIKDGDQIIFMVSKKKQATPTPQPQEQAKEETKVTDPILSANEQPTTATTAAPDAAPAPEPAPEAAAPSGAAPASTAPPDEYITRLMELGYSRDESVMALQLANNDPNRACELLLMGLTEEMVAGFNAPAAPQPHAETQQDGEDDHDMEQEAGADDDDLFAQAAAAAGGDSTGAGAGAGGAGARGGNAPRSISLTMEDLMQLRRIVNGDPESLQPFLENMISRYPQLEDQIQSSPEMFLAMLLEGLGGNIPGDLGDEQMGDQEGDAGVLGESGDAAGANLPGQAPPNTIQLTQEENDAINRLCELGNFDKNLVIQIYFACDKNEELAANLLFTEHSNFD
ncbi:hypothetical protein ACO0QE_003904 [Hanseniaspora vineae]